MSEALKEDFKKASKRPTKNNPRMPVISARDGVDDLAYMKLRAPLRRQWPHMSLEAKHTLIQEIQRIKSIRNTSEELGKCLDQVGLMLALSWEKKPVRKVSLRSAQRKLNETHAGMDKVKEKCIELIAAMNSSGKAGGVICLDGPPGVGKTSIARSVARAMGRPCEVVPMGGVTDPSFIRGTSRHYIGAGPSAMVRAMKRAGVSNPVLILDEGDKVGGDSQNGNPSYALLELLDPSQNKGFKDHFLDVPYDMSDVLFIVTTNNVYDLPQALVDRMEIIALDAYSSEEKMSIAEKHLIPHHLKECGLTPEQLTFDRSAIELLIESYTQEPGVRKLEQHIKNICRKTNAALQKKITNGAAITADNVKYLLGPSPVYKSRVPQHDMVGCTTGLYFSNAGGGILPIQVKSRVEGKYQLSITGLAGQMIKESAQNAMEMIKHNAERYGIDPQKLDKTHIHMHLPDAGTPKDGPSAGIASATAMISSLTGIKTRQDVAMTGEVDLYGNVLPIGGLKQKLEGARKAGATTVLIPDDNQRDLQEVPVHLKKALKIIPVKHMDDVLKLAMTIVPCPAPALLPVPVSEAPPAAQSAATLQGSFTQASTSPAPAPAPEDIEKAVRLMTEHPEIMAQAILRVATNKGPA